METILEVQGITKTFGSFVANDDVSLQLCRGEIHSLLGENGAGKTTLMNVLYGLYRPTQGTILLEGRPVKAKNPKQMLLEGIAMVHQHFMLVPTLTVAENVVLGNLRPFRPDMEAVSRRIQELAEELGFSLNPKAKIGSLSVGERQRVEIIKALYRNIKVLILDEPTAVLTPGETQEFLVMLRRLAAKGIGILFISHKFDEVLSVSDRITVMRRGKTVGCLSKEEFDQQKLAQMMTGHAVDFHVNRNAYTGKRKKQIILDHVCTSSHVEKQGLKNISFSLESGQILAIAGVDGNGQDELLHVLQGLLKMSSGKMQLVDTEVTDKKTRKHLAGQVGYIPADRHIEGLVLSMSVEENLILENYRSKPFSSKGLLHKKSIAQFAADMVKKYDIRLKATGQSAGNLSGGNQQKVVLSRALYKNPKVIFAAYPTRGLDVGAIESIHNFLNEQREKGCSIVLISNELDEVFTLGDIICVMYEGALMGLYPAGEISREQVGLMMAGKSV